MSLWNRTRQAILFSLSLAILSPSSQAALVSVTVTVQNLAPANGIAFAPLRLGFNNGTFDSFNINQTATAPIVSVAEGGTATDWFPAFAAADPTAVLGTVVPNPAGPLLAAGTGSGTFVVDTAVNRFFTFGSMVVPSNDLFIGNDNPTGFQIFNANGDLLISQINQTVASIWDANSEVANPANAAFVAGGNNSLRTPENGLVAFDASELAAFNGVTTGAGYTFSNAGLISSTPIYRISFSASAVPEPNSMVLVGLVGLAAIRSRIRRQSTTVSL